MEVRCDDPRCLRIFYLMSYHVEASSRLDGKVAFTVTCPSCGQKMSSIFELSGEKPENQSKGKEASSVSSE